MDPRFSSQSANPLPDCPITRLPDSRAAASIGRAARLELVFEARGGRTVLAHAYVEPPLRIGRVFDLDGAAYVILVCSGAGVFAGDALRQSIHIGRGARVVLTSQSALQVHPAPSPVTSPIPRLRDLTDPRDRPDPLSPPALLRHEYIVEEDAELHCQWDAVIPFAGARLDQRFDLRIAESSRLSWGDALMAGRVSRGESWLFLSLAHELRLHVGPALAYLERYSLAPGQHSPSLGRASERTIQRPWMCGTSCYMATTLVYHQSANAEHAESLHREMARATGVGAAVDLIAPGLLLARFLAGNGASFSAGRASYRASVLRSIFGGQELAGRK
jgi:urease accessory protein UreH